VRYSGAHRFVSPMDYVHAVQKVADCLSGVEKDALQKEFENKEMDAEVAVQAWVDVQWN
jgi:hypothetical protein